MYACYKFLKCKIRSKYNIISWLSLLNFTLQDIDESENVDEDNPTSQSEQENLAMETLETAAGDSTPVLMPPELEGDSPTDSPDDKPSMEVFDLQESSSESISPDMEAHALFIKLKEVRLYWTPSESFGFYPCIMMF